MIVKNIFLISTLTISLGCKPASDQKDITWYKGNTHAHTLICGHADTSPDSVALWYLERDYNFLILSEHNHFIDPSDVQLPENRRKDFILIPGEEVTGKLSVHTTAMNIRQFVDEPIRADIQPTDSPDEQLKKQIAALRTPSSENKTEIMQRHTDSIRKALGVPILNHPNFSLGVNAKEILPVKHLHMFELYNGHPDVFNWGKEGHVSVEMKWDSLLTAGMLILGVSSDDAHHFQEWTERTSNPGRGWVMVNSRGALTPKAITHAMERGDFYATNGVTLDRIESNHKSYKIIINKAETLKEISTPFVTGKIVEDGEVGFKTEFIATGGKVVHYSNDLINTYTITQTNGYVRAKITFTREADDGKYEQFYAWTQPQFLDERNDQLKKGGS